MRSRIKTKKEEGGKEMIEDVLYLVMILAIAGFTGVGRFSLSGLTSLAMVFMSSTFAGLMALIVMTAPKIIWSNNGKSK